MTGIVEFINACLDEDQAVARTAADFENDFQEFGDEASAFADRFCPARVLADVAAKRRILAEHSQMRIEHSQILTWHDPSVFRCRTCDPGCQCYPGGDGFGICDTLRFMAAPYADHPDYDESWRP